MERLRIGAIPATLFQPDGAAPAGPVVVIAHGFAGSQQLMLPAAVTLARNGYRAVTFDFPGHGRNPEPFRGGLSDDAVASRALLDSLDRVVAFARSLPGSDGRLALLGHSMASDIVVRYALAHPEVAATVALSMFGPPGITATAPADLLVVVGGWEPALLRDEGLRVAGLTARQGTGGPAAPGVTYGRFADGTARRFALAPGVEHIGVLYSTAALAEARDWLNQAFGRSGGAPARCPRALARAALPRHRAARLAGQPAAAARRAAAAGRRAGLAPAAAGHAGAGPAHPAAAPRAADRLAAPAARRLPGGAFRPLRPALGRLPGAAAPRAGAAAGAARPAAAAGRGRARGGGLRHPRHRAAARPLRDVLPAAGRPACRWCWPCSPGCCPSSCSTNG
ncbi:MAG: alpha/beta fold hydrolase [Dongiaceae bacterium]